MNSKLNDLNFFLIDLVERYYSETENMKIFKEYNNIFKITDDELSYMLDFYTHELIKAAEHHPLKNEIRSYSELFRISPTYLHGKRIYMSQNDKAVLKLVGIIGLILNIYILKPYQLDAFSGENPQLEDDYAEFKDLKQLLFTRLYFDAVKKLILYLIPLAEKLEDNMSNEIVEIVSNFTDEDVQNIKKAIILFEHFNKTNRIERENYIAYSDEYHENLKTNFDELVLIKNIIVFKSLPKKECLKKIEEYQKLNGEIGMKYVKQVCDDLKIIHQKKFGLRSFQKRSKIDEDNEKVNTNDDEVDADNNDENDNTMDTSDDMIDSKQNTGYPNKVERKFQNHAQQVNYYSNTHNQQQTMMSINFDSAFSSFVCSSINIFIDADETDKGKKVGMGMNISDINITNKYVTINTNTWTEQFPCYDSFHKNNKPFFIKIDVPGHIYCAFVLPNTKEIEIWNTGNSYGASELILANLFTLILPDYKIILIDTRVQGNLSSNYKKHLSTEKEWTDVYCQSWIYLHAFLRLVLNYTPTEIILYILSLDHSDRLMMINAFQTQLSNNGDNLKYLDVVQDMNRKGWKNRLTKIKENIEIAFDGDFKDLKNIQNKIDYIFESAISGKPKYNVGLRSTSTSGTFENYFWTDFSKLQLFKDEFVHYFGYNPPFNRGSHISIHAFDTLSAFFNITDDHDDSNEYEDSTSKNKKRSRKGGGYYKK